VLIFSQLTPWDAEDVAAVLRCNYVLRCNCYHAEVEEGARMCAIDSWRKGNVKVLVTTSTLGVTFHYNEVKLVLRYGKPQNIINFVQESGQAGRNLSLTYSTVMWDSWKPEEWLVPNQDNLGMHEMTDYLKTNTC
jgi:superfamily II DNA helicase RecQ